MTVLQKNKTLNKIQKDIIEYLYRFHLKILLNGILKKKMILHILESLIQNKYLYLDPYLDLINDMLLRMIFSQRVSINITDDEDQFHKEAARILSVYIITYQSVYPD